MKLHNKINLYTAFLFAILLVLMNLSVYFTFSKLILNSELNIAKKEMEKVSKDVGNSLGVIPAGELLRSYVPINGMIQIITEDNKGVSTVTTPTEQELSQREMKYSSGEVSRFIDYNGRTYIFESMPIIMPDGNVGNLQIMKSIQTATENLNILRIVLILVTFLALIPVIISSRVLSNLITKPVTTMIKTMTEIRQSGNFKRLPMEEKSKDELFQMGETFNHMIDLLETNFEKQQQFVSNASHELKTPITIIESYASLLKRRGLREPELFAESIEAIHSEAIRMKDMTEQLLLLAKHTEQWNLQIAPVNLADCLQRIVKAFMSAYNRKIEFNLKNGSNLIVDTDEQKLKQLIFIFLDNARKYSDDVISVMADTEHGDDVVKIIDRGIGIPKDELPRVYDRFYRVDKARSRKHGGSGLGLSLAKEIADAIGVQIRLESEFEVGTTATLYIKMK